MSYVDMAIVAALGLLLIFTLVAFGMGHKRWSIVSVVAAFLVALTIPTYLYFAAQLLHQEWRWAQSARGFQEKIARARDGREPSPDKEKKGRLEPVEGMPSIGELQQTMERWQRALTRADNWRGRHWDAASFTPPPADGETGTITLPRPKREAIPDAADVADVAAEGDIPAAQGPTGTPIDPGATVYVFEDAPRTADGGGKYLGAFLVQSVAVTDGRHVLTVQQTAARDAYDTAAWNREYDSVSVFTELPTDRWLAFSETSEGEPADDDKLVAPAPKKRPEAAIDEIVPEIDGSADGIAGYLNFRNRLRQHSLTAADVREAIDESLWADLRKRMIDNKTDVPPTHDVLPGEYWAEVTFKDRTDMEAFLGVAPEDIGKEAKLEVEMDFAAAYDNRDDGTFTIDKVFYRRPLLDGLTLIHGTALPGNDDRLVSEGVSALRKVLKREIASLEAAKERLDAGLEKARAEQKLLEDQTSEFKDDIEKWERDVAEATRLADRFEAEVKATAASLRQAEEEVVKLGRALVSEIGKAVQEVDRVAPAAGRRGATAPSTAF